MDTSTLRETGTGCPFGHGRQDAVAPAHIAPDGGDRDGHVLEAIDRWSEGAERDGLALARLVTAHVRTTGKHFLSRPILVRLARIGREHGQRDPYFDAFLHGVLDKHEDRYYNATYISLPLLDELLDDATNDLDAGALSAQLMADVIRHEAATMTTHDAPDARTTRARITHALRFIAMCNGTSPDSEQIADLPRLQGRAGAWFELTVLPVYTAHDEYFFIRALQAHEMTYRLLTAQIGAATSAIRNGSSTTAARHLARANTVFARSAGLFRLVATMRAEHFHAFRDYTQGASAIQSESYKCFELACGRPTDERLDSDAYTSVPTVRAGSTMCPDDFSQAYLDARRDTCFSPTDFEVIDDALTALETAHQRWKATHHSLARKMLGDATGSGYTSGVPYLKRCLENRLFFRIGAYLPGSRAA
jgi:tryptophan 2,3-dioxygenase